MQVSINQLKAVLAEIPRVKFAYLFGSQARGDTGPLSDMDIAVYVDRRMDFFRLRLILLESLAQRLSTDRFDLVVLNDASPLLKYEVVRQGVVIKENRQRRIPFEVRTLSEYFDTEHLRKTQRQYLKEKLAQGVRSGQ